MNNYHEVKLGDQVVSFHNQGAVNIGEQDHSWLKPTKNMDIEALKNGAGNPHANWEADMDAKKGPDVFAIPYLMNLQQRGPVTFNLQSLQ